MKVRAKYQLPKDREKELASLVRLEWVYLGVRTSIIVVLAMVLGNSQAMKAAWLEDILALTPTMAFLIAMRYRDRAPNVNYPYGFSRATMIAFLCASFALAILGIYLVADSGYKLIQGEHPTIGAITLFGHTMWLGWLMIAALTYSVILPMVMGHLLMKRAVKAHEKTVLVDAKMSKADWMTGLAGIVGVLGLGMGFWWADALAGLIIGLDVSKDGITNVKEAVGDLVDRRPHETSRVKPLYLEEKLEDVLRDMDWVKEAGVRMREEGHVLTGEAFVVPHSNENLTERVTKAANTLVRQDWRILEVTITPVPKLDNEV